MFLVICLLYGMLHALGPGHGKSIVVGYFIARRGRWRQGVALGAGITVTHTMSAVLLLLILYAIFLGAFPPESLAEAFRASRSTAINAMAVFLKCLNKLVTAVSCDAYQVE